MYVKYVCSEGGEGEEATNESENANTDAVKKRHDYGERCVNQGRRAEEGGHRSGRWGLD
jgi:hypothetical protein